MSAPSVHEISSSDGDSSEDDTRTKKGKKNTKKPKVDAAALKAIVRQSAKGDGLMYALDSSHAY